MRELSQYPFLLFQAGLLLQHPGPDLLPLRHLPPDVERHPHPLLPHPRHRARPSPQRGLRVLLGQRQRLRGRPLAGALLRERGAGRYVVGSIQDDSKDIFGGKYKWPAGIEPTKDMRSLLNSRG